MRTLVQPGPVSDERIEAFQGRCERFEVALTPGLTLAEAIRGPLVEVGVRAADHATEVLVRCGVVRDGVAETEMAMVDMQGGVHLGRLVRGENAVCITFDAVLEEAAP